MVDYEKMNDDELRAALESEGFDEDEIEEILSNCRIKSNECIKSQKKKIRETKIKNFINKNKPKKLNPGRGL